MEESGGHFAFKHRFFLITLLFFIGSALCAQQVILPEDVYRQDENKIDDTKLSVDGPYVFYKADSILLKYFDKVDGQIKQTVCEYVLSEKNKLKLICKIDNEFNRSFSFSLFKKQMETPSIYPVAKKIFVISDYEGNFNGLYTILVANKVIDRNYNWIYGSGHFVILGDIFDRGWNVTQCLWLLYKLDQEAIAKKGRVHVIIGNHEVMNLKGDDRYVLKKYKEVAKELGLTIKQMYNEDTEIGRWLRTKNVIEKIGNTLFVHGGISDSLNKSKYSLEQINAEAKKYYQLSKSEIQQIGGDAELMMGKESAIWYRGYFVEQFQISTLAETLKNFKANNIVVGHTIVEDLRKMFAGKLYAIDVEQPKENAGVMRALLIENGKFFKVTNKGDKESL